MGDNTKDISDGYHTFGELYEHRHALLMTVIKVNTYEIDVVRPWWTRNHHPDNDPMFDIEGKPGILVGLELPTGSVQYHLPARFIKPLQKMGIPERNHGPFYNGVDASPAHAVRYMHDWFND